MAVMGGADGAVEAAPLLVLTCIPPSTSVMVMVVVLAAGAISSPAALAAAFRDEAPDDGEAATMMALVSLLPSGSIGPMFVLSPSCQIAHAQSLSITAHPKYKLSDSVSTTSSFQLPIEGGRLPVTKLSRRETVTNLPRHKLNNRAEKRNKKKRTDPEIINACACQPLVRQILVGKGCVCLPSSGDSRHFKFICLLFFFFVFFWQIFPLEHTQKERERERDTGEKTPSCRRWGNNTLSAVVDDEKERVRRETSEEGAIVDDVNRRAGRRSSGSQVDARSSNINDWAVTAKQQRLCATLGSRTISFSGARTHTDTHTPHRRRRGLPSAHVDLSLSALCLRLFCLFRRRSLYSPRREKKN